MIILNETPSFFDCFQKESLKKEYELINTISKAEHKVRSLEIDEGFFNKKGIFQAFSINTKKAFYEFRAEAESLFSLFKEHLRFFENIYFFEYENLANARIDRPFDNVSKESEYKIMIITQILNMIQDFYKAPSIMSSRHYVIRLALYTEKFYFENEYEINDLLVKNGTFRDYERRNINKNLKEEQELKVFDSVDYCLYEFIAKLIENKELRKEFDRICISLLRKANLIIKSKDLRKEAS